MANLKADSPLCRRIALSFLDFLNSVEPSSASDTESLEVAKDCLSEVFKIDSSSTSNGAKSDSLVQIFSSQTGPNNEIKSEHQIHRANTSCINNNASDTKAPGASQSLGDFDKQYTRTIGVREDELFGQFFGALEKVHYFGDAANGDDEQALDRATHLFHNALMEMKKSGSEGFDLKNLADTFKLQGNKAMQSKVYPDAIELYTVAIALRDDNAIYYCNRAAALTQIKHYPEAISDCLKAIEIDPNYSKAYSRLGFTYYALGAYRQAIDNGFKKALELDPNNESIKGNIEAAEQKFREQQQRAEHGQNSRIPTFTGFPTNLTEPYDLSSMVADLNSQIRATNNPDGMPGIRVGISPDDHMPPELFTGLRSAMQMFRDQNNSNSNPNPNPNSNGN